MPINSLSLVRGSPYTISQVLKGSIGTSVPDSLRDTKLTYAPFLQLLYSWSKKIMFVLPPQGRVGGGLLFFSQTVSAQAAITKIS